MGAPGGPRAKNQDGGVRVSVSDTHLSVSSPLSDGRVTLPPQALIKRRLENRAKRSSSSQAGALGLNKGSRFVSSVLCSMCRSIVAKKEQFTGYAHELWQ